MHFSTLVAFGQAGVVAAQYGLTSSSYAPKPTQGPNYGDSTPKQIGDFQYHGCVKLSGSFEKVSTNDKMSLDFCAASCPSGGFGVYNNDCFCTKNVEVGGFVADNMCDYPCPGASGQKCGGVDLVTVYKRIQKESYDYAVPGETIIKTVTRTTTGVVTACPPEVKHCPLGSKTTGIYVEATPFSPISAWHKKKVVCYGDYCAPEHHCPSCERYRVVCSADYCHLEIATDIEHHHKLVICKGGDCRYHQCHGEECNRKVVCYDGHCAYEKCFGEECHKNLVCRGEHCRHEQCRDGHDCNQKLLCQGEQCRLERHCGHSCPHPAGPGVHVKATLGRYGSGGWHGKHREEYEGHHEHEYKGHYVPEYKGHYVPEGHHEGPEYKGHYVPEYKGHYVPEHEGDHYPEHKGCHVPENKGYHVPENKGYHVPENKGYHVPEYKGYHVPENKGYHVPEHKGEYAPEKEGHQVPEKEGQHVPEKEGHHAPEKEGHHEPEKEGHHAPEKEGHHEPEKEGHHEPEHKGEYGAEKGCPGGKVGPHGICKPEGEGPGGEANNGEYPVQIAGSSKVTAVFNVLGVAAGLAFIL